ncbi:MAG: hypothetical protein PW788_13150 [Micavibrio sp.]|nr:hypothetical protein [Micavibrio sp.]
MSKFTSFGDGEKYGDRRAGEFEWSGGTSFSPIMNQPSGIEKQLINAGMDQREIKETAVAITTMMGRMKNDSLEDQQRMVKTFMGRCATTEAVANITKLAKGEPLETKPAAIKPVEAKVTQRPPAMGR